MTRRRILPTFTCFDDVAHLVGERVTEDPALLDGETLRIVHGIALAVNGPHAGTPYAHAWVEEAGLCWDAGLLDGVRIFYAVQAAEYYVARRIWHTTRYTIRQAVAEEARTGTCGPWRPAYVALCRDGDRRVMGELEVAAPEAGPT